jgi:hypothetical protein
VSTSRWWTITKDLKGHNRTKETKSREDKKKRNEEKEEQKEECSSLITETGIARLGTIPTVFPNPNPKKEA